MSSSCGSRLRCVAAGLVAAAVLAVPALVTTETGRLRRHAATLAAPELEGRLTGTPGARRAATYIAGVLRDIGARPLPGRDDYRLPFEFTAGVTDAGTSLTIEGADARRWAGADLVQGLSFSETALVTGPAVFAGYGLVVPDGQESGYDSYAALDVTDRIVLVLRHVPEDADQETRALLARYSSLRYKAFAARERGAKAVLFVTGPRTPGTGSTMPMAFDAGSSAGIVAASVSAEVGAAIVARAGRDLSDVQRAFDAGDPHVTGFEIADIELTLDVRLDREIRTDDNLVGYLPPTGEAAPERPYIVLGAHYDHIGHGLQGSSLARPEEAGQVHPGADDNASGVAAVLEAGARLAAVERRRGVVLALWSGEEIGLIGSSHFIRDASLPIDQVAAYLNFDMVGRMRDNRLILQGVGSSSIWPRLIEQVNVPAGFDVATQADPFQPTDLLSFNLAGVPSLGFFTGAHADYHRPTDEASRINYEDLDRIVGFATVLVRRIADLEEPPDFIRVERTTGVGDRAALRVFTGTIPDYATEVEGLRLSGVIEGGPAARAGLREGDVIVELAGRTIANIYDYTYALDGVRPDEPVRVVFLRDGQRHEVELVPAVRR